MAALGRARVQGLAARERERRQRLNHPAAPGGPTLAPLACNPGMQDPTYMIRAIPTTSNDRIYCKILAHNAVHAAFAGTKCKCPSLALLPAKAVFCAS